jgi:DNA-binding transcriptional MocR family regulator
MIIRFEQVVFLSIFSLPFLPDASAFVPSSTSNQRLPSRRLLVNGHGGAEMNANANGGALPLDEITTSPGEATLRLGLNSGPTVWTEFGRLSRECDLVNLGQGFPDWLPPKFAVDSLVEAVLDSAQSPHQYTRSAGHPNLVNQLARRYSNHMKREINPLDEVAVTVGASQALYLSLQTLIKPGTSLFASSETNISRSTGRFLTFWISHCRR